MKVSSCALLFFAALAACRKTEQEDAPPVVVMSDAGRPTDHLAKGELPEGTERAFGIVLPVGMVIDRRLFDLVLAEGAVNFTSVEEYVKKRVGGGTVRKESNSRLILRNVRTPSEPNRPLEVVIEQKVDRVRLEVRDITPPPPPPEQPTEELRWKAAGLKPNGEPLDPTKLR